MESGSRRIAIVGAGIGGLACAIAIQDSHYRVDLFERHATIRGTGSGLTLWPNATHVLKTFGILEECEALSGPLNKLSIKLPSGRILMKIATGSFATPAMAMHRGDLHRALMGKLRDTQVFLDRDCLNVRSAPEGSYLVFADGEKGPYDLVVAADGMRSKLRTYVAPGLDLKSKGYRIWRGIADGQGLLGDKGEFYEIWGKHLRFGYLPMANNQVCWYAARNQLAGDKSPMKNQKQFILDQLKTWNSPARDLVERTSLESLIPSDVADLGANRGWSRDNVLLIGDAIHPMPANLGLGGNMALEDALALGTLLKWNEGRDIERVCQTFEALRFGRVRHMIRSSNRIGFICQAENEILRVLRNGASSILPGSYFTWNSRKTYGYRADEAALGFVKDKMSSER